MLLSLCTVVFLFVSLLTFTSGNIVYAEEPIYGHISYVDKQATVIREDQTEHKAVVNLPVVPGDQVVTGDKGRCELQFDNGTIIRLDENTRLKVTTVLAPSLTSRWKITTLRLLQGQVYAMVQAYNREMFQVITSNAALDIKNRSAANIQARENGDTFIHVDKGKFKVMYGEDIKSIKTETARSGKGYMITAAHQMRIGEGHRDIEFKAWNDYINRKFNDLHRGINRIPKRIYHFSKALVHWAEKWSSLYGEWLYDDVFGYVWRPYDEYFAYSERPFFHADFAWIHNRLYLIPQEPWGWLPAYMGTWAWMKWGWTWIPGDAFITGLEPSTFIYYYYQFIFPSLNSYIYRAYGNYDLYYIYRDNGLIAWQKAYKKHYKKVKLKPSLAGVPRSVRNIIKKMNKKPVKVIKKRLGKNPRVPLINLPISLSKRPAAHPGWSARENRLIKREKVGAPVSPAMNFRDWNPDVHWALRTRNNVQYSSKTNEVVCPNLKLSSRSISAMQRAAIRNSDSFRTSGSSYSYSDSGKTSTALSAVGTRQSGAGAGAGAGSKGAGGKKK
jgi:hypothetical protein